MRVGMWAAAAAVVLCAGQAQATTFVRYTLVAAGTIYTQQNTATTPIFTSENRDFYLSFTVDADQNPYAYNMYYAPAAAVVTENASGGSGSIIASGTNGQNTRYSTSFSTNDTFNGIAASGGLATSIPDGMASGSVMAAISSGPGNAFPSFINYVGTTSRISVAQVANFTPFAFGVLPEPEAWAMMIVGMGLIGSIIRRCSRALAIV